MEFFSFLKQKQQPQEPKNWKQALVQYVDIVYIFVIFMVIYLLLFRVVVVTGDLLCHFSIKGVVKQAKHWA